MSIEDTVEETGDEFAATIDSAEENQIADEEIENDESADADAEPEVGDEAQNDEDEELSLEQDDESSEDLAEADVDKAQSKKASYETPELTDDELDKVADTAIETLRSILCYFGAQDTSIDEYEGENGELILDVVGGDLAVLIGRYGKTLDALQFLVAAMVNKTIGFRYPIVIDIEGYRYRRRQKLESMAKSSATRCIRSKKDVRLRPMTPYERRIIHIILRNESRVFTESDGDEPYRCVVIKLNDD